MIGSTISHFEVVGLLGKGGMGEVYRAHDTKLERDVALKVLPADVAGDPERMARFEREAKVLASLNHANIATLYGIETAHPVPGAAADGPTSTFLVMELVDGEDLAQRLTRGPIALDDAVDIARQMAQALEAAHSQGIVHRDLKPANIKLTPDGGVKVLDFGLARAYLGDAADASGDVFSSPTITAAMTQVGTILGTAAYMSPEQAKGRTVDARADLWAFGVILFEMLTGRHLFEHETVGETLAAVLRADIDLDDLPTETPPSVRRLLRRCLERDPRRRLRAAGDAWLELEEAGTHDESVPPAEPKRSSRSGWLAAAVMTVIAGAAGAAWLLTPPPTADDRGTLHVSVALPEGTQVASADQMPLGLPHPTVTISPDGMVVAAVIETDDGETHLFRRRLDQPEGEIIPGSEGAIMPRFSPDGRWIAFTSNNRIKRMRADGDRVADVREVTNAFGLTWTDSNHVLCSTLEGTEVLRIDVMTGEAVQLGDPDVSHRYWWPSAVPGMNAFLANDRDVRDQSIRGALAIVLQPIDDRPRLELPISGTTPTYLAGGFVAATKDGGLTVARFDAASPESVGRQVTVLEKLLVEGSLGHFDVSSGGDLVYVPGPWLRGTELVWVDGDATIEPLPFESTSYGNFELSPDGRKVAAAVYDDGARVWVYDLERGTRRVLSTDGNGEILTWSPDGDSVAFSSTRDGRERIYVRTVGSPAPAAPIGDDGGRPYVWHTPDMLLSSQDGGIVRIDPTGARAREVLINTPAQEWGPDVSPDGRWMAYTSDESGRYEIYVRSLVGGDRTWPISVDGGEEPLFTRDGRFLFYRYGTRFFRTPILEAADDGSVFRAGNPEVFVEGPFANVGGLSYDVAPDGSRLLVLRTEGGTERPRYLDVVLNWFPEMRRTLAAQGATADR
jgi:dipeptidyl aminopeptidase/acylaminoacyl peptidase